MNWVKDNVGKVISAVALIFTIIGFLAGMWREQVTVTKDIEKLKLQIQDLKDGDIWWIKQRLNHFE